jgi:predicted Rossmann-fold nucleotide-binding protein
VGVSQQNGEQEQTRQFVLGRRGFNEIMNVCVFCGSGIGSDTVYAEAARELGISLAQSSIQLIYGGGNVGLMGALADSVMQEGGQVAL